MCLYPQLIKNRKYTANKKNGGNVPPVTDERTKLVPIGCGNCKECRKKKAREWQARIAEDIKTNKNGKFITLTFSNESIYRLVENTKELEECKHLKKLKGYQLDNAIATVAIRLFTERWRKRYGKTIRHWLVTELGHKGTENIHLHGIIWTSENFEQIEKIWQYGHIWPTKEHRKINYVTERTVNYIVKYVSKIDKDHKQYKPIILTSNGIGANYTNTYNAKKNKYDTTETNETYRTSTGHRISLPIYWRNKIYSEKEKENLWLERLDKDERWINGNKISVKNGYNEYNKALKAAQQKNVELGYGTDDKNWEQKQYEEELRQIQYAKRLNAARKKWAIDQRKELLLGSRTENLQPQTKEKQI